MLKKDNNKSRQGSPSPASPMSRQGSPYPASPMSPFNNLNGLQSPVQPNLQRRPSQLPGNKLFYQTASQNTAMRRKR